MSQDNKKITIIGGGVAGLAAGCYAKMNGFEVDLYEKHLIAGGLCTGWKRKKYIFDFSNRWVTGVTPNDPFYQFWKETGAIRDQQVTHYEVLFYFREKDGSNISLYSDLNKLRDELLAVSPEDKKVIDLWIEWVHIFSKDDWVSVSEEGISPERKFLRGHDRKISSLRKKTDLISLNQFKESFKSHRIRNLIDALPFPLESSLSGLLRFQAQASLHFSGWVTGGGIKIAEQMKHRFTQLGGEFYPGTTVSKILCQGKSVFGVELGHGQKVISDYVISAADGHSTIFNLLNGVDVGLEVDRYYSELSLYPSYLQISFGITEDLSSLPQNQLIQLPVPIVIGGKLRSTISFSHFAFDKTMAPEGCSSFVVGMEDDYHFWKELELGSSGYLAAKQDVLEQVENLLYLFFPQLKGKVAVRDVATPLTLERYTGNWMGASRGWMNNPESDKRKMKLNIPGIDHFFQAGQWVTPGGGLAEVLASGRGAVIEICKKEAIPFQTTVE